MADSPSAPPLTGNSVGLETRLPDLEGSLGFIHDSVFQSLNVTIFFIQMPLSI